MKPAPEQWSCITYQLFDLHQSGGAVITSYHCLGARPSRDKFVLFNGVAAAAKSPLSISVVEKAISTSIEVWLSISLSLSKRVQK